MYHLLKGYESLTVVDKSREQFNDHSGILSEPNPTAAADDVYHVCSVVVVFVVVALGNVCIIYLGGTGRAEHVRRRLGVSLVHPSSR